MQDPNHRIEFVTCERTVMKEEATLELLARSSGYTAKPSISYEIRAQDGQDYLVLLVSGLETEKAIGAKVEPAHEFPSQAHYLSSLRRRLAYTMLIHAIAEAGRRMPTAATDAQVSRFVEDATVVQLPDASNVPQRRIDCALLELAHAQRQVWVVDPDGEGVRLTLRLVERVSGGKVECLAASTCCENDKDAIVKAQDGLRRSALDALIRRESALIERRTAEHSARTAAAASA